MSKLYYEIADQLLCVDALNKVEQVRTILHKYEPFRVETSNNKPLLEVLGDASITLDPLAKQEESINEYGLKSIVYKEENSYYLMLSSGGYGVEGRVSKDWDKLILAVDWEDEQLIPYIDRLIMIAYSMALFPLSYLKMHASVTELDGKALIFMGVSGTGKSTHSRLWKEFVPGCTLLNDDEPFVRLMPSGGVRVYGCPWSGSTPCYRKVSAEVVAFVHLYQAQENKLSRLNGAKALMSLYTSGIQPLNLSKYQDRVLDLIQALLDKIPVYRLDNRPEKEAVQLTRSLLK